MRYAVLDDGRKVHYERYLLAMRSSEAWGVGILDILEHMFGGEDLTLPEKSMDHRVRFELKRQWNDILRSGAIGIHTA